MSKYSNYPLPIRIMRRTFPLLERFLPSLAKKITYKYFFYPIEYPFPSYELPYLDKAIVSIQLFEETNIKIYQWGNIKSENKVLLVHGWAGRATQFRKIIDALIDNDLHVISFDAPGHGKSEGETTATPQIARIVAELQSQFKFKYLIGHSLGGAACIFSIIKEQVRVDKLILISAPASAKDMLDDFMSKINGGVKSKRYLRKQIFNHYGKRLDYFFADSLLPFPNFPDTLAIHDTKDHEVRFQHLNFLEQNISTISTLKTTDLGHTRILRDEKVLNKIIDFLD